MTSRRQPRRRISRLRWADGAGLRGTRHGVKASEIEVVLRWDPYLRTDGISRTLAYGATGVGRYLLVVLRQAGPQDLRVVAARDLTDREREAFRGRRR
jgi:uncharacterized DUF497 family protein